MKKHIPNLLTSLNLFSGCIACIMAFNGLYFWVVIWVIIAAIFDFFDGFMARILNAPSPVGKDLDSLADMVSFGFTPGLVVFTYLSNNSAFLPLDNILNVYIPYIGFLLTVFSALRLAKFNNDERQTTSFIGLNTPANTLFWISYIYWLNNSESSTTWIVIVLLLVFLMSFLLIAELPMFSLKIKSFGIKGNELRYLLIVFFIVAFIIFGIAGIATGILFYIGLSVIQHFASKKEYNI